MSSHRHVNYRGSHFSSETLKAMEQSERVRDSQARRRRQLERKMEARRRKLEGQQVPDEPTLLNEVIGVTETISPPLPSNETTLSTVETPKSTIARLWESLKTIGSGRKEALH